MGIPVGNQVDFTWVYLYTLRDMQIRDNHTRIVVESIES